MRSQWNDTPETEHLDTTIENRVWKKVQRRIDASDSPHRLLFYKTIAIAASLLLFLSIGGMFHFTKDRKEQYRYVIASGVRSIESVTLPDGTLVQIGPNSRLVYPSHFDGETRDVELTGQAFFNVAQDKKKPFTVHTKNMNVTALGTAFEVFNYEYENRLETILLEGKVKVGLEDSDSPKRKEIILTPDEMLIYDKLSKTYKVKSVNAGNYSGWRKQGVLTFENEQLSMIISRLEPWYGRKIICPKTISDKYRFTFKVRDESLERILFILSNSSPIKYKEINDNYELYIK